MSSNLLNFLYLFKSQKFLYFIFSMPLTEFSNYNSMTLQRKDVLQTDADSMMCSGSCGMFIFYHKLTNFSILVSSDQSALFHVHRCYNHRSEPNRPLSAASWISSVVALQLPHPLKLMMMMMKNGGTFKEPSPEFPPALLPHHFGVELHKFYHKSELLTKLMLDCFFFFFLWLYLEIS